MPPARLSSCSSCIRHADDPQKQPCRGMVLSSSIQSDCSPADSCASCWMDQSISSCCCRPDCCCAAGTAASIQHQQARQRCVTTSALPWRTRQQQHSPWLVAVVLLCMVLLGVPAAAQQVDITVRPPTAKTASIAYTWGLAASVTPAQVTMAVAETRQVSSRPVGWGVRTWACP